MKPLHYSLMFTALNQMLFSAMRMSVALDALRQGASPVLVGSITALFAILPALGSVHMGRFIDRRGTRAVSIACPFLLGGAALAAALLPQLAVLALAALTVGGAYLTLHIINHQVVGRLSAPEDRPANFALSATWAAAASAFGPIVAGYSIDHAGFQWTYIFGTALPLLGLSIIAAGKLPFLEGRGAVAREQARGNVFELLREPRLRRVYIVNVMFGTSWDVFLFMTPIYGAAMGLSASQIGTLISCFTAATFAVRMFARPVSRRYSPWQIVIASQAVNGVACLAFGLSQAVTLLMLSAMFMGLGHGLANPMMNSLLYERSPAGRVAEVMGLRTSVSMTLQFIMPVMAGALGGLIGIAPLFWLTAAMQLGGSWSERGNWRSKRAGAAASGLKGE